MKFGVRDNSDDEVIATYNVYASPAMQHELHIFQFPLRRKMRPYEASEVKLFATDGIPQTESEQNSSISAATSINKTTTTESTSVLRPSSRLTMHCRIDTFGSSSFSEPKNQQQQQQNQNQQQQRRNSYHYALQSHPFKPRCDYCIGFIVDGAIHLTPVSTIQQFTPIVRPTIFDGPHRVGAAFISAPSSPIVPGLAISDRIQRELLRQRSAMLNTDAETARELQHFIMGSVESVAVRRRLWGSAPDTNWNNNNNINNNRIEDSLFPPELLVSGGITGGEEASAVGSLLRRYANRHSVLEQVIIFLRRCQVLTLNELRELVTPPDPTLTTSSPTSRQKQQQKQKQQLTEEKVTDEQLLEALREGAVWMHGVWISKTAPKFKGTIAALREVILLQFFESSDAAVSRAYLNRLLISTKMRRAIKEVLESISSVNSDEPDPSKRVWRLWHVPADKILREKLITEAQESYPQEIAFQRMQWEKFRSYIMEHLNKINNGLLVDRLLFTTRRQEIGNNVVNNVTGTAAAAVAAANAGSISFKEEELTPIIAYIRRLFLEHGVLNKQRAKELVMRGKQRHYPEATNPMLSAALQRCVQPFTNATWVLKTLGEQEVDRYRPLILETALELVNFETRAFNALLEEKRKQHPISSNTEEGKEGTNNEDIQKIVSRVLAEVAVYQQHERLWHLKSGNVMIE